MTTPNNKAGLLDAFLRYQQLSVFWARNGTPADLAVSELQEYLRLSADIPEQIKRLIAFASCQASQGLDTAEPRESQEAQRIEWRIVNLGEMTQDGDEYLMDHIWHPLPCHHMHCRLESAHLIHRRRIAKPEPQYRMLEAGEVIQEGDEWLSGSGNWAKTNFAGEKFAGSDQPITKEGMAGHYRRPIPAPVTLKADYVPPSQGKREQDGKACDCGPITLELLNAAKDLIPVWENESKEPGWAKRWMAAKHRLQMAVAINEGNA